ncbi:Rad52/Rad22 family DNA repair protein [Deinococcus sp. 23YEL01]|uniref:Rad52/Rad22 family DNA repair protein n=1 Tax=Deinococcus sp. 23YEL01 TaxID=2745871 RepID=UPI001E354CC4|nr:Rad52/Rad22 family DNA repair protein [Deinococcus sp. 23YEL01]MCD0168604.1 single-stranded DNA-binding protein [Deinococcus sp. 23YEL01]
MTYAEFKDQLAAPFPARRVLWRAQSFTHDRTSARMVAYVDARTVMERLDEVCPDAWEFDVEFLTGALPAARGQLTVLGLTRCDVGEAGEGDAATLKAAASDALKRCAVHFGIGRYLYDLPSPWVDWDEEQRAPVEVPRLPEWALGEEERANGATHVLSTLDALRATLPRDVNQLREVYRLVRAALDAAAH